MSSFIFQADRKGRAFSKEIAFEMMRLFRITEEEAIGRINKHWKNFVLIGEDNVVYHEDSTFWAKDIYYGPSSRWWNQENNVLPQPYP